MAPQRIGLKSLFKGHALFFLTEDGATGTGGIQFCLTTGILSKLRRSEGACYLLEPDICCCDMISSIKKPGHQSLLIQLHPRTSLPASWEPAQPRLYQAPAFAALPCLPSPWDRQAEQIPSAGPHSPSLLRPSFCLLHGGLGFELSVHAAFSVEKQGVGLNFGLSCTSQKKLA